MFGEWIAENIRYPLPTEGEMGKWFFNRDKGSIDIFGSETKAWRCRYEIAVPRVASMGTAPSPPCDTAKEADRHQNRRYAG
jgi:hypothetical protein